MRVRRLERHREGFATHHPLVDLLLGVRALLGRVPSCSFEGGAEEVPERVASEARGGAGAGERKAGEDERFGWFVLGCFVWRARFEGWMARVLAEALPNEEPPEMRPPETLRDVLR